MEKAPALERLASCNPRKDIMLSPNGQTPSQTSNDRKKRVEALIEQLRPTAEAALRQMAERLVDLPEDKSFGQVEHDLRDLALTVARSAHQAGLQVGEKRAT
jgi:hypothetical protein